MGWQKHRGNNDRGDKRIECLGEVNSAWSIYLENSKVIFRLALFYNLTKPELKELALVLKHRILMWDPGKGLARW